MTTVAETETLANQWLELFYTHTPHPKTQKQFRVAHDEIISKVKELDPTAQQIFAALINKGVKQRGLP